MTLSDLTDAFRVAADDTVEPYLWSDDEIASYLSDAESEACIRSRLIVDETTAGVAVLSVGASAFVTLHSSVIDIFSARLASAPDSPLVQCPRNALDSEWPGWETLAGTPTRYHVMGKRLRLFPAPTAASDTLYIGVYRTPITPLSSALPLSEPEIPEPHHARLLDWALYRAFMKRDADSFDMNRSDMHRQLFLESFGPRPSGSAMRQHLQKRRHAVTPIAF